MAKILDYTAPSLRGARALEENADVIIALCGNRVVVVKNKYGASGSLRDGEE